MCGLNAIFAYGTNASPVDAAELARVRDYMTPRGPDGCGAWIAADGRVGLGHRRLAIIDLDDRALQPMASADGKLRIVFNGEIYNFRALRDELASQGARFATESDTEVLLHLYARHGAAMVDRLRGMYAFALWDEDRRGLLLARDPFGIKPLYLADDGRTLRAASQVKALLHGGGVDTSPCAAGTAGYFLLGYVPEPHTLYKGITALPAGTTLWVGLDGARRERRFFDLTQVLAEAERAPEPFTPERLRALLADSVAHHFVADVEVGVFLSAGIDSATLTALSAEIKGSRLRTVTLGFDEYRGTAFDEPPLAEAVAAACGTTHETRRVRRPDFEAEFGRILAAMDQPSIDGVNTYFVSKVAKEAGLKVALSGLGGDELFAGYPSFAQVPSLVRLAAPFASLPALGRAVRTAAAPLVRRFTSPKYAGLLEYGTRAGDAWLLRRALFMPWELAGVIGPDMARDGLRDLALRERLAATEAPIRSPRLKVTALEASWYMRNQLLRDADWAGMAHSLEIRVPLVDATLVAGLAPLLAGTAPPGKRALARTPLKALPRAVVERPKSGFVVPVREWITEGLQRAGVAATRERGLRGWARTVMAGQGTARRAMSGSPRRILIYRLGSLGDTVVALPVFHLLERLFPGAERRVLTNVPVAAVAAPLESVLWPGFAEGHFAYPIGLRRPGPLWALARDIARWRPEVLVYATGVRGGARAWRDALFFRLCGIPRIVGLPVGERARWRGPDADGLWESEGARLARALGELGDARFDAPTSWSLELTAVEREEAAHALRGWPGAAGFVALGIGTKQPDKDWGDANWAKVLARLARPGLGLALIGAAEDSERSARLAAAWPGPVINLCGRLAPRASGAAIGDAILYLGIDSGPMHLAAAVGTPCVAVFSTRIPPGVWFPHGAAHRVLYPGLAWSGGVPVVYREATGERSIADIPPEHVAAACEEVMARPRGVRPERNRVVL